MIQINLLDQASAKVKANASAAFGAATPRKSGSGAGGGLIFCVAALMIGLNGWLFWMDWQKVRASNLAAEQAQIEQRKLKDQISKKMAEAEQIRKYRDVVANQMDVLKSLDPADRILWCEKINELSNLMPAGVFLSEVKINEAVKMVETAQSREAREKWAKSPNKDKTKEPAKVEKPVINYIVRLTGLALGKDNVEQAQNVSAFHKALIDHVEKDASGKIHHFMDGFNPNIEFESLLNTTYEETAVNKFIFRLTTKPMGEDAPAAKPATPGKQVAADINLGVSSRQQNKNVAFN